MQIKNVDNFNLQDCEKYLNENPNSELANAVKIRQTQLMNEILQSRKKDEETRKTQINSYREKMKWVSIEQFNAKKRYRDFSKICILFIFQWR